METPNYGVQIEHLEMRVKRLLESNQALSDTNGKLALARVTMETERDDLREKLRAITAPAVGGVLARMAQRTESEVIEAMQKNLAVLDRVKSERDAWHKAALNTGLYRSDADVSTPEKWCSAQTSAAVELLSRAEKAESQNAVEVANRKVVEMNRAAWEDRAGRAEAATEGWKASFGHENARLQEAQRTINRLWAALEASATVFDEMDTVMWTNGCPVNYRTAQDEANELLNLRDARAREGGGGGGSENLPAAPEKYNDEAQVPHGTDRNNTPTP